MTLTMTQTAKSWFALTFLMKDTERDLCNAMYRQIITGVYDKGDGWFSFRTNKGKIICIHPAADFEWRVERLTRNNKIWLNIPGGLRVDCLRWITVHNHKALVIESTGMARSTVLKLTPTRSGEYRLVFPNL